MTHRSFHIVSLGCKVNQYDGQALRERLLALGLAEAPLSARPDVVVVNTCAVTSRADEKCRQRVRAAVKASPGALVIVTGCGAAVAPERFRAIPGVSLILAKEDLSSIGEVLDGRPACRGGAWDLTVSDFGERDRAFLKIQDGCDAFCSYCIVPYARGKPRSRPLADIGDEARRLADRGFAEIVLTGVHLGLYGQDLAGATLVQAVRQVLAARSVARVRISSIEVMEVTDDLLALMASEERLCPHLHLPLQSGDNEVLRAMNRRYTAADFLRVVDKARRALDRPAITTDVLVAFPGETDAQAANTLRVCEQAAFSRMHVFRYSRRPGTAAARLPLVNGQAAAEREAAAIALARDLALRHRRSFVGQTVAPLTESRRDKATGMLTGFTERYAPVLFQGPDTLMGRIARVRAVEAGDEAILGERIAPAP
ncbi:MAG TPA: tRNA (N(6)-L-threonylcarbamoyladenosine(37)-C(2))-methylthiotransferase MtaB [Candidatus Brocadiia bacterium]|mgnify:FL=1|nr:tRNA (N(6)-L-threonylcarbamoyladenosine(37)-C(2))-methylthiotransferase MtaB [Candidatus Brocadiia bacterium]